MSQTGRCNAHITLQDEINTGVLTMTVFRKLDVNQFKKGLVPALGGVKHFAILSTIAIHADTDGISYPSQETIAALTGYSRKTINEAIKELRDVRIDGEPVIIIKQQRTSKGRRNVYQLMPASGFSFTKKNVTKVNDNVTSGGHGGVTSDGHTRVTTGLQEEEKTLKKNHKEEELVFDNARSVLDFFRQKYFEKYDVAYKPNWAKDQATIKNQIMKAFTDEQIVKIIDVVFDKYDTEWANSKFPRPTIGQISSWLGNKALAMAQDKQQEAEQVDQDEERYSFDDSYFDKVLDEM